MEKKYMLYKSALEGNKKKALIIALSGLGGGGIGYLTTRYGLGIKDPAALAVGTGIGGGAGALFGGALKEIAGEQDKKYADIREEAAKGRKELSEKWYDPRRYIKDALSGHGLIATPASALGGATGMAALDWRFFDPAALDQHVTNLPTNIKAALDTAPAVKATALKAPPAVTPAALRTLGQKTRRFGATTDELEKAVTDWLKSKYNTKQYQQITQANPTLIADTAASLQRGGNIPVGRTSKPLRILGRAAAAGGIAGLAIPEIIGLVSGKMRRLEYEGLDELMKQTGE